MYIVKLTADKAEYTLYPVSVSVPETICNDNYQHVQMQASVSIVYEAELLAVLALAKAITAVISDDDTPVFSGIVNTGISWSDNGDPTPIDKISLTIEDNTYLLNTEAEEVLVMQYTTVREVTEKICERCGVSIADGAVLPDDALEIFVLDAESNYASILDELLFQYGRVFYFNASGALTVFDFTAVPVDLPPLTDEQLITGLSVTRSDKQYGRVKVLYNTITVKYNEQVYFSGGAGYQSDGKVTPVTIQPNQYYPYEANPITEEEEGQVYQEFENGYAESKRQYNGEIKYQRSKKTELIYTENHRLSQDWEGDLFVDRTGYEAKRASVRFINRGTEDAYLYQLAIRADAWYRSADVSVTAGTEGEAYEFDARYIYTAEPAERFAKNISRFVCSDSFKLSGKTLEYLAPGFYRLDTGVSGLQADVIITSCTADGETGLYSISGQTFGEAKIDITRFKSQLNSLDEAYQGAIADVTDKIDDIISGGENISAPDIPEGLSARASESGIYIAWSPPKSGLNNTIKSIHIDISRDAGKTWSTIRTAGLSYQYEFNRLVDGYPEIADLYNYEIRIRSESVYGKMSEYSASVIPDVSGYKTWRVAAPAISAKAYKDTITITLSDRNSGVYGTVVYDVFLNGTCIETITTLKTTYPFDRKTDGYPEVADLKAYEIAVTVRNEASRADASLPGTAIDMTEYKTWLTPPVAVESCVAKEDGIYNEWTSDESLTFGSIRYRAAIYYDRSNNPEPIALKESAVQPSYTYLFNRNADADGYPETADTITQLAALGLPIRGRNLDLYSLEVTSYTLERPDVTETETAAVLTDYYGTWVPPAVEAVRAEASRDAIHIEITDTIQPTHYGTPYSYIIELKKGDASDWQRVYFGGTVYDWPIDRTIDGYPERIDLDDWRVRVKSVSAAKNESFFWGGTEAGVAVDTGSYGTWLIEPPAVQVTVSGRSITLAMQQPPRAGNIEQYGSIRYRLQIQKPEESEDWKKPAQNLNPYTSEDNWQDGEGSIIVGDVYTQTMPLTGQTLKDVVVEGETVQQSAPVSTLYRLRVTAFSEASESDASEVNATALATGIQDIVQGSVTHDKISTPSLAAISANMGVISSGGFAGSALNYWYLSTIMGQLGVADRYEGSMRVGGEDEYLLVEPIVEQGRVIKYKIVFKVGNFEVSSEASRVNGELVVMENASSLDRTRITPIGTYYEHRETSDSEQWRTVSQMRTDGIRANSLYSDQTLVITNATLQDRRKRKRDVGRPYLSDTARVWHFDTDLFDQYQLPGLEVSAIGDVIFADQYNMADSDIDFTPAILAVAPYSEIGRSAYGQFNASIELAATNTITVDLWVEYIWNENQVLFDIGNDIDRIKLVIANEEPYLNDYTPTRDEAPLNAEMLMPGDVIVLNEPAHASSTIQHYGNTVPVPDPSHVRTFDELGIAFERNMWLHVGIILSPDKIGCYLNKTQVTFDRYSAAAAPVRVMLNELRNTLILDELYIDTEVTESFADFAANTDARIPWGALDKDGKYFILEVDNLLTNIFDTDEFKTKVKALIQEAQS